MQGRKNDKMKYQRRLFYTYLYQTLNLNSKVEMDFSVFEAMPGISVIVRPDKPKYTLAAASAGFLQATGLKRTDVVQKEYIPVFSASFPPAENVSFPSLTLSLDFVLENKTPHTVTQYSFIRHGKQEEAAEHYLQITNTPYLNEGGEVLFIVQTAVDITGQVAAEKKADAADGIKEAYHLFMAAPVIIGVLKDEDYIIELANEGLLEVWGRKGDVVGQPLLTAIPELQEQGIKSLLDHVRLTGEAFYAEAFPITLVRKGKEEVFYFDFVYKPVYDKGDNGKATGVISIGHDVTEQVRYRQRIKNVMEQATDPILILMGEDLVLEAANQALLELWQVGPDALHKPFLEILPEMKDQVFLGLLQNVLHTGQRFYGYEQPAVFKRKNGMLETRYVDFSYQPYREADGTITGVLVMATDVSEQVKAKQKLVESERNLRNTILQAPVAMCIFRGDDYVVEVANDRMFAFWGKEAAEVLGKPIFESLPEAKNQGFEDLLQGVMTTGKSFSANELPVKLPRPGGVETIYVNFVYEPFREGNGSISGVIAVAVEVSDQVKARLKIEQNEQYVRAMVESAPFPIAAYEGREMKIVLANKTILDIWGKGHDVVGKNYASVLPELDNQAVFLQLEQVYTTGTPFHAQNQQLDLIVDGKKKTYYFNYSFTPIYGPGGAVVGVMNTGADVTDLNIAKQQIEQSERNFRSMILQAPVAMCILMGPDLVVDIANEAMIQLWGKPVDAVMHKPIFEGLPDAREQGLEQILAEVYQTGQPFYASERPVRLLRNGKTEVVFQNFVYEPYKDANGKILGILAISVDVTPQVLARQKIEEIVVQRTQELAQANASLVRSNEELRRSNANLEEFAHAASHDMKEPIRKVLTFADRLKSSMGSRLMDKEQQLFERMENATQRMGLLVDDLLEYSHVSERPRQWEQVDLNESIHRTLVDLELLIEDKKAHISIDPLPVIKGHKRQLQQLFQNLLSNALKYSKPGVPAQVSVAAQKTTGRDAPVKVLPEHEAKTFYQVEIKDNGIGFDQMYAERIFAIFQRLHGRAEYPGTGVGLSIARKVAENHNGYIWAESKEGAGAAFYVLLPGEQD